MQRKHKEKGITVCEKANLWTILYSNLSKILIYSNVFKIPFGTSPLNVTNKWKYGCPHFRRDQGFLEEGFPLKSVNEYLYLPQKFRLNPN